MFALNTFYAAQDPIESAPTLEDAGLAAVLLYGLQLASTNAKSIIIETTASPIVCAVARTKSGRNLALEVDEGNFRH